MIAHAPGGTGDRADLDKQRQGHGRMCTRAVAYGFTLGFGIVNEVYYPGVEIPQIRDSFRPNEEITCWW